MHALHLPVAAEVAPEPLRGREAQLVDAPRDEDGLGRLLLEGLELRLHGVAAHVLRRRAPRSALRGAGLRRRHRRGLGGRASATALGLALGALAPQRAASAGAAPALSGALALQWRGSLGTVAKRRLRGHAARALGGVPRLRPGAGREVEARPGLLARRRGLGRLLHWAPVVAPAAAVARHPVVVAPSSGSRLRLRLRLRRWRLLLLLCLGQQRERLRAGTGPLLLLLLLLLLWLPAVDLALQDLLGLRQQLLLHLLDKAELLQELLRALLQRLLRVLLLPVQLLLLVVLLLHDLHRLRHLQLQGLQQLVHRAHRQGLLLRLPAGVRLRGPLRPRAGRLRLRPLRQLVRRLLLLHRLPLRLQALERHPDDLSFRLAGASAVALGHHRLLPLLGAAGGQALLPGLRDAVPPGVLAQRRLHACAAVRVG
mmetsp:Transcript_30511/g.91639  ORF Transcript_30511/g.91639 Transcript_30511/m.91639 type:complete len:427 (-) Transcript_30511:153-1433(-)